MEMSEVGLAHVSIHVYIYMYSIYSIYRKRAASDGLHVARKIKRAMPR